MKGKQTGWEKRGGFHGRRRVVFGSPGILLMILPTDVTHIILMEELWVL